MVRDNISNKPPTPQERRLLEILTSVADKGEVCPTNDQICAMMNMQSSGSPPRVMNKLVKRGKIQVERFGKSRIVTILETGKATAGERGIPHFSTKQENVPVHRLNDDEAAIFKRELEDYLVATGSSRFQLSMEALGHSNGVQYVLAARNPNRDTARSFREAMLRCPKGYPAQVRGANVHNVMTVAATTGPNIRAEELAARRGEAERRHAEHVRRCLAKHREKYGDAPFGKPLEAMPV